MNPRPGHRVRGWGRVAMAQVVAILWPLRHDGPMRLRDLAERKGVDQSTVSRQISHLVGEGLVRRDPDPADRRACQLVLTDRGQALCRDMIDARRDAIGVALRDWPDDRIAMFVAMFRDFNEAVEAQHPSAEQTSAVPGGSAASQENS